MGFLDVLFGNRTSVSTAAPRANQSKTMLALYHVATEVIPERLFRDENHQFLGGHTFIKSFITNPMEAFGELLVFTGLSTNGQLGIPLEEMRKYAAQFKPQCGVVSNDIKFLIMQYPTPLPTHQFEGRPVVGPFHSAFVYSDIDKSIRYYLIRTVSASPRLDIGVVRELLPSGNQLTLCTNCPSTVNGFLDFVRKVETTVKPILGGVKKNGEPFKFPLEAIFTCFPDATAPNMGILQNAEGNPIVPSNWRAV